MEIFSRNTYLYTTLNEVVEIVENQNCPAVFDVAENSKLWKGLSST